MYSQRASGGTSIFRGRHQQDGDDDAGINKASCDAQKEGEGDWLVCGNKGTVFREENGERIIPTWLKQGQQKGNNNNIFETIRTHMFERRRTLLWQD